jgi:hypothetical protein
MQRFLQPHLASGLLLWRGREESTGTSKPNVVATKVVGARAADGPEPGVVSRLGIEPKL